MDELKEIALLLRNFRYKIKDFSYIDHEYISFSIEEILKDISILANKISKIVNHNLAELFVKNYSDVDEAIFEIDLVLEELMEYIKSLQQIYNFLKKNEANESYRILKAIVKKLLTQIEIFFIRLENIVLSGANGELELILEADEEISLLKNKLKTNNGFSIKSFLAGIGFGWLLWSE